jgi:hypothetical protein
LFSAGVFEAVEVIPHHFRSGFGCQGFVCHDPGFYQFLGENFRFYFACVD